MAGAGFAGAPGAVEGVGEAGADALDGEAEGFAGDVGKTLHAEDGVGFGDGAETLHQGFGCGGVGEGDDEAFEVVVFVLAVLGVVVGGAGGEVVLGVGGEAQEDVGVEAAVPGVEDADGPGEGGGDLRGGGGEGFGVEEVGLVEDDEVGAVELIVENFGQGVFVVEIGVFGALAGDGFGVVGEAAGGDGGGVDDGEDAIDGDAVADAGPVEGFKEGLGEGQAGGLDDEVGGGVFAVEKGLEGGEELVGDGAAEAAVGEFHDVGLLAGGDAAAFQEGGVYALCAEFVDYKGQTAIAGVLHKVLEEGGFAGAQEAGDDGGGDHWDRPGLCPGPAGGLSEGGVPRPAKSGMRPNTMRARDGGRREGRTVPVGCTA